LNENNKNGEKNLVALLAQQAINLNKVACIRLSEEQNVFKTKNRRSSTNFIFLEKNRQRYGISRILLPKLKRRDPEKY
jgi:hypothetical protein